MGGDPKWVLQYSDLCHLRDLKGYIGLSRVTHWEMLGEDKGAILNNLDTDSGKHENIFKLKDKFDLVEKKIINLGMPREVN